MANYTELVGIQNSQDLTISNILLENFISFYDWGFFNKGGFYNISIPTSGAYGGSKSTLKPQKDPNYTDGRVWQSHRGNWVWEPDAGVGTPIPISGVYINGSFTPSGYSVDYLNGRVIMNSPIPINSNVTVAYSYKWLNVTPAKGISWLREIQKQSNRVDDPSISTYGSGNWAQLGQSRVQLPALAIEVLPPSEMKPYQLGGGQLAHNDIIFSVITENDWECSNILDIITHQNDRGIYMYDPNKMAASGVSVFRPDNSVTDFGLASGTHPSLVENFRYQQQCYIFESKSSNVTQLNPNLYMGTARCKTEVRTI
jgi:hypothetical protein